MKTTDAITMITFLLVAITASGVVSGEKEVVLDSKGNPVKPDKPYFVIHSYPGGKAFITRYGGHRKRLLPQPFSPINPEPVIFSADEKHDGPQPVFFILPSDVVRVSTELHIHYDVPRSTPGLWRVRYNDVLSPFNTVDLTESWTMDEEATFTIQKLEGAYRFAFGSADKPVTICADTVSIYPLSRLRLSNLIQVNTSCFPPVNFVPAWMDI